MKRNETLAVVRTSVNTDLLMALPGRRFRTNTFPAVFSGTQTAKGLPLGEAVVRRATQFALNAGVALARTVRVDLRQ